jgi:hypothetical protein
MGPIVDLSFAHIKKEVVLGCVDDAGNLFVYRILEQSAGKSSVVDTDPDWIRIQWGPSSMDPDPERGGQVSKFNFLKCWMFSFEG